MCFSASASFTAAVGLAIVGGISFIMSRHKKSYHLTPLSLVPLFFALQQASEGVLWLALQHGYEKLVPYAMYSFLFFAFLLWPLWIPSSLYYYEQHAFRRRLILGSIVSGLLTAGLLLYSLIAYPTTVEIASGHIHYQHTSIFDGLIAILYIIAVIVPFFMVHNRLLNIFGVLVAFSCGLSAYLWYINFASIWCFFAAILSFWTLVIIYNESAHSKR